MAATICKDDSSSHPATVGPAGLDASPSWPWLLALLLLTAVRLGVAGTTSLSPDEAYYWIWSRALAPGFLDHPPMVALWIRAGTLLCGQAPLGVRLLAPLSAFAGSLLLFAAARDLLPGRHAGLPAAALLNATLLLGVGAVTMTPDTPLLLFWVAALWSLGRLLRTGQGVWWLACGGAIGAAAESKYTALLLGLSVGGWLLSIRSGRRWLRTPWPWMGALLALLAFAPDAWWNALHGWASLAKQGGRTGDWHPARALGFEAELLGGQFGLATPGVFLLCLAGIWGMLRPALRGDPAAGLLCWLTLLPMGVFVQHALGGRVQANWPAVAYPAAVIAAAALGSRWWRPAGALGLVVVLLVYLQAVAAPFALPGRLDVTLARLAGWQGLGRSVAANASGAVFVSADEYGLASELAWNGRHWSDGPVVLGLEPRWRLFALPRRDLSGRTGLLLRSNRRDGLPDPADWADIQVLATLPRGRGRKVAETYTLYRVTGRAGLAGTVLPSSGAAVAPAQP